MKNRILSIVLACLLVTTLVGTMVFASDETPGSSVYDAPFTTTTTRIFVEESSEEITTEEDTVLITTVTTEAVTTAADVTTAVTNDPPQPSEYVKGVVFKKDSGFKANTYTGYVEGVEPGDTAEDLYDAMDNSYGVYFKRDNAIYGSFSEELMHGDMLALTSDGHNISKTFTIIFMGNANRDGKINLSDASAMLQKIASWDVAIDEVAADVDGNGTVNLTDVSTVLKKVAGWDVEFVKVPVLPGIGDNRITSITQTFATGNQANINLRKGQDLGVKFSVEEGLYAKSIRAQYPSWGDSKGSLRLSLYKWNTDYETTVAAMPIVTEKYENFADCAEIVFDLTDTAGKGIGEGEYLWRIHEGFDERLNPNDSSEPVGVGMWTYKCPAADSGVTVFFEGIAVDPDASDSFGPEAYIQLGK